CAGPRPPDDGSSGGMGGSSRTSAGNLPQGKGRLSRYPPAPPANDPRGRPRTARKGRPPSFFRPHDDVVVLAISCPPLAANNPAGGEQRMHRGLEIGLPQAISLRPPCEQFGRVV